MNASVKSPYIQLVDSDTKYKTEYTYEKINVTHLKKKYPLT